MPRRTKIVCTLGPASWSPDRIAALVEAGMDVARINFSHGDLDRHAETIRNVRDVARRAGRPIAILGDLQGPKIRVGALAEPVTLHPGDAFTFAPEGEHRSPELPTTYAQLADDLEVGDVVLLADGLMELIVTDVEPPRVTMRVIHGGTLTSAKGINLPGVRVSVPSLTEKDMRDLAFALEQELDYLALSFVREAEDVLDLAARIPAGGPLVVVKVEKGMALQNLQEILDAASAAMVARGDLGVELPFEQVPLAQKRMIQLSNFASRPVITATQMLESMIENPRPTRAEASDVANAIIDGTDAVMLSAETATGRFPVQAVQGDGAHRRGDRAFARAGDGSALRHSRRRALRRLHPHRAGDRPRDGRGGAAAEGAGHLQLHHQRGHGARGVFVPAAGADPGDHRFGAHVHAARHGVGRHADPVLGREQL
jgi:pyruvate kinase